MNVGLQLASRKCLLGKWFRPVGYEGAVGVVAQSSIWDNGRQPTHTPSNTYNQLAAFPERPSYFTTRATDRPGDMQGQKRTDSALRTR